MWSISERAWVTCGAGPNWFSARSKTVILSLSRAPASTLAPIGYMEMPSAVLVGWIGFGDVPDVWTFAGILVIVGAGLYVAWRENQLANRAKTQ